MFHVKHLYKENKLEYIEFKEKLTAAFGINELSLTVTDERAEKLFRLTEIMLEVNKTMNLTAITDEDAIIVKHYVDSLTVAKYIPEGASVLDVGCGAGFPCLPLAIFREDLKITALDATAKRIRYIENTVKMLGITNVTPIAARAEELGKQKGYRESFDIVTARAVASLPVLSELCLPFVKVGGSFISMKASQGEQEALLARNAITLCGGSLASIDNCDLKSLGSVVTTDSRFIISIRKISSTSAKFPRHFSQISKKPL